MTSTWTKKFRRTKRLLWLVSLLLNILPLGVYFIRAFVIGEPHHKAALSMIVIAAIVFTVINIARNIAYRSSLWLLLLGIYFVIENIVPLILLMAFCTIADELIVTPLYRKYTRYTDASKVDDMKGL